MQTNIELRDYVLEQLSGLVGITYISMMGGFIFYIHGRIFGGIYGSDFMLKITEASKKYMPDSIAKPPYKGAKPMLPLGDIIEDSVKFKMMVNEMYS